MGEQAEIGIIGGQRPLRDGGLRGVREVAVDTRSAAVGRLMVGTLEGRRVAFLPRHGRGHRILPHELNFRANVFAMKTLGVEWILSVSAVGSLKEQYAPAPHGRCPTSSSTAPGSGSRRSSAAASWPTWPSRTPSAGRSLEGDGRGLRGRRERPTTSGGTYVCMEGPQFSTLAESELYRSWGTDLIGMTNLQEAKLAREAEICYSTLAMVTDYDCWHPDHDAVTVEQVIASSGRTRRRRRRCCGPRSGGSRPPRLRVRDRPQVRAHHPARARPGGGQAGARADHRPVHEVGE